MLQTSRKSLEWDRAAGRPVQPDARQPGSILSFVPAHGGSHAGVVSEELSRTLAEALGVAVLLADFDARGYSPWHPNEPVRRLDGRTWGALVSDAGGLDVLDASAVQTAQLGQLLEYAREYYSVVCADLTHAKEANAVEVLRASDGIFLVSNSDRASLQGVRDKVEWLRSMDLAGRCGLLLGRDPKGATPCEAEEFTGVPVCSLIDTSEQLGQLAGWLGASSRVGSGVFEYALAV